MKYLADTNFTAVHFTLKIYFRTLYKIIQENHTNDCTLNKDYKMM
jgi:hypothetical protein